MKFSTIYYKSKIFFSKQEEHYILSCLGSTVEIAFANSVFFVERTASNLTVCIAGSGKNFYEF